MTDLQESRILFGDVDETASLIDFRRDRFLHEHIAAGFDQLARDIKMRSRWSGDDGTVDCLRQCGNRIESTQPERFRDFCGNAVVHLDESGDLRLRHFGEHASVEAAEVACADDADAGAHRMNPRCE